MDLPELSGTLIHHRSYDVQSYREGPDRLRLRGTLQDQKPPGLYIEDDEEPLTVHHMVVDLLLEFPSMTILEVAVVMGTTPTHACSGIEPDYQQLVGMSIARGFARQVKNVLGGANGCTHVGALLQAMAPVAIQSMWSMRSLANRANGQTEPPRFSAEDRRRSLAYNLNTCHVWAEDGPQVAAVLSGASMQIPVWAEERLRKLGRDPEAWRAL